MVSVRAQLSCTTTCSSPSYTIFKQQAIIFICDLMYFVLCLKYSCFVVVWANVKNTLHPLPSLWLKNPTALADWWLLTTPKTSTPLCLSLLKPIKFYHHWGQQSTTFGGSKWWTWHRAGGWGPPIQWPYANPSVTSYPLLPVWDHAVCAVSHCLHGRGEWWVELMVASLSLPLALACGETTKICFRLQVF